MSRERFGEAWDRLFGPPIAHRGLWSPDGPPENSLAAFEAAVHEGYAIELDVQLSSDDEAVVFHDLALERMTGVAGRVAGRPASALAELRLAGTEETIPTLADALAVIGHKTLVLIELKTAFGHVGPLERRVCEVLIDHHGPIGIIGFNPYSHAWFADHHPHILRGLNSYAFKDQPRLAPEQQKAMAKVEHVGLAKPHFLSLGLDILPSANADQHRAEGMPVLAWTVRQPEEWRAVQAHCDNYMFEGMRPHR